MNSEENTQGSVRENVSTRISLSKKSLATILDDSIALELFPELLEIAENNARYLDRWPPPPLRYKTEARVAISAPPTATYEAEVFECVEELSSAGDGDESLGAVEEDADTAIQESEGRSKSRTSKGNAKRRAREKAKRLTMAAAESVTEKEGTDAHVIVEKIGAG